jgi:hypothetical protein
VKTIDVEIMDTNVKTSILEQGFGIHSTKNKIHGNKYELEVVLEDKVYLEMYNSHQLKSVEMDEIPTKIKSRELQIARWTLTKINN